MELKDVLDINLIKIELDVHNKDEVIRSLGALLLEHSYIDDLEEFVKDVYVREAQEITGIGNGVAIPHAQSNTVKKPTIAIATLKNSIEWETLDDGDVDMIFLFTVDKGLNFERNHMLMLSKVAAKLADDDLLIKMKKSASPQDVIDYLTGSKE